MGYLFLGLMLIIIFIAIFIFLVSAAAKGHYECEQREIKRAGNAGEAFFSQIASRVLNENDILINNLVVEANGKEAEIDNLIINENGIFIIEVKNYNGTLYGSIEDYSWTKRKVSPGGNVFTKEVKNPIKQMRRQTGILSQYLKDNNIWIWIEPYAYFVRGNSPVDDECVIKNINELEEIIHTKRERTYRKSLIDKAVNLLSK